MDTKKLVALLGKVLTVTAGVLVAFQVQTYLAKRGTEELKLLNKSMNKIIL